MITLNDIDNIESNEDVSELDYYKSIQGAINSGAWSMQGSYGRTMMDAIKSGYCLLGLKAYNDYWGNHIPSRLQVVDGTVGSWEFVKNHMGIEWATTMAGVK
jgi:hypothetical protein